VMEVKSMGEKWAEVTKRIEEGQKGQHPYPDPFVPVKEDVVKTPYFEPGEWPPPVVTVETASINIGEFEIVGWVEEKERNGMPLEEQEKLLLKLYRTGRILPERLDGE
jgi:hypothetical protein